MEKLEDGDFLAFLFFLAIMALYDTIILVYHMKDSGHRFVVGDTFRIVTFDQANQLVGKVTVFFSTTS